jgi:hypothetical protein
VKKINDYKDLAGGMALAACLCSAVILHHVERDSIAGQLILCPYNDRAIADIHNMDWKYMMTVTGRDLKFCNERRCNRERLIVFIKSHSIVPPLVAELQIPIAYIMYFINNV